MAYICSLYFSVDVNVLRRYCLIYLFEFAACFVQIDLLKWIVETKLETSFLLNTSYDSLHGTAKRYFVKNSFISGKDGNLNLFLAIKCKINDKQFASFICEDVKDNKEDEL